MALIQQMVHKSWLVISTFALTFVLILNGFAETPAPEEIFQRLLQSYQSVNFTGKFTFVSHIPEESPVREAQVIRKAPDKQRIEFLWPPEVRGTGMVMAGNERWPLRGERGPGRRPFLPPMPDRLTPPMPDKFMGEDLFMQNIRFLLQNYKARILDGGRIAGRDTYMIELESKSPGRPSRKVWIDKDMSVILKMENYDSQKKLRGFFVFSEINFNPEIDESAFRVRSRIIGWRKPPGERGREEIWNYNQGELDIESIKKKTQLNIVLPGKVPEGFILESIRFIKLRDHENIHLRYTDGLAMLSVFESPSDGEGFFRKRDDGPPRPPGGIESINIAGVDCEVLSAGPMLILRWKQGDIYITLMGEMERKEMIEIVRSFSGENQ